MPYILLWVLCGVNLIEDSKYVHSMIYRRKQIDFSFTEALVSSK